FKEDRMLPTLAICAMLHPALQDQRPEIQTAALTVEAAAPGKPIDPRLYGIFFEEINNAGDGGIYAELLRNRSFEDGDTPNHWKAGDGSAIRIVGRQPATRFNRRALEVRFGGRGSVANEGYWGVAVRSGWAYDLSVQARSLRGRVAVTGRIVSEKGAELAAASLGELGDRWAELSASLRPKATDGKARLVLEFRTAGEGLVQVDHASLFPKKTFRNRKNGLRPDLAQLLADLKPAFVRFPGGCWVEGDTMATAYRWKTTIGPLFERRTQPNLWGYQSTNGLGFHEYLQMAEDIGAEPLFVINVGMAHRDHVPMDQMDEFVQDALDAIEYANGPADSKWGALRAANGHPKPFGLRLIEIGNENGGPLYAERYRLFVEAIRARHPEVQVIANVWGGYPREPRADFIDEHYYSNPEFFFDAATKYDTYDRKGPKVYVGEYAVTQGCGQGNLIAAVAEAAFMTGMERNSDVVAMASYAPLFANVNHKGWNPDLICFDGLRAYGTPSYYVQKLFAHNRGDRSLPVRVQQPPAKPIAIRGGVGVGTWHTQAEYRALKVTVGGRTVLDDPTGATLQREGSTWSLNGALRQTGNGEGTRAVAGRRDWGDLEFSLQARKVSGDEGFLILFGVTGQNDYLWLNLGGWGNSRHAVEHATSGARRVVADRRGSIETGRWYDIRVETRGPRYRCYLDGELILEGELRDTPKVFASATKDLKTGELILKLVNGALEPVRLNVDLKGLREGPLSGSVETLTSAKPTDENSLEEPRKVAPHKTPFRANGPKFERRLPAHSVTVIRIRP
ncbi:MAG: alpha-L-arabinofuranosidase, partial [Armatimonadetes bacterium]|nr:alpha-L-arabinofuranosidase [Armatimonadota bacterium]